jgi:hypothetical protein
MLLGITSPVARMEKSKPPCSMRDQGPRRRGMSICGFCWTLPGSAALPALVVFHLMAWGGTAISPRARLNSKP